MFHKRDDHAREGWDPEEHPRSVKSGRTNDEVAAEPDAEWRSDLPAEHRRIAAAVGPADRGRVGGTGRAGCQGLMGVRRPDAAAHQPRQGAVPWPRRRAAAVQARSHPLLRIGRSGAAAVPPRPAGQHPRPACRGPGLGFELARRLERVARRRRPTIDARLAGEPRDRRAAPVDVVHGESGRPTYALVDIDPGPETTFDDVLVLARLFRSALDHLGVVGRPKVGGRRGLQIWVPVEPGPAFDEIQGWVDKVSDAVGATVPELVKTGATRDVPSDQRWSPRTACGPRREPPCPSRSSGTSSTTPICGPTAGRSARRRTGSPPPATRSRAADHGAASPDSDAFCRLESAGSGRS